MALFLSTYVKKIDKKGRVLVPNAYRGVLTAQSSPGVVVYGSFINPCIEACGMARIEALAGRIEALDPFSEEYDAFASTLLGGSLELAFDGEGRIMLPENLLSVAGITEEIVFVGKGQTFELWEPARHEEHAAQARKLALEKRLMLRAGGREGGA